MADLLVDADVLAVVAVMVAALFVIIVLLFLRYLIRRFDVWMVVCFCLFLFSATKIAGCMDRLFIRPFLLGTLPPAGQLPNRHPFYLDAIL